MTELARAYAGLARGGTLPPVRTVRWIRTATGDTLRPPTVPPQPMGLSADVAFLLTDILSDAGARAPGFGRGGPLELPFPTAVKTGTSKDYRDNWAVGATPRHTVAVLGGGTPTAAPCAWVSGISGAGPILNAVLREVGSGGAFPRPPGRRGPRGVPDERPPPRRSLSDGPPRSHTGLDTPRPAVPRPPSLAPRRADGALGRRGDAGRGRRAAAVYGLHRRPSEAGCASAGCRSRPRPRRARRRARASPTPTVCASPTPSPARPTSSTPVLRSQYQKARLRGTAEPDLLDVTWVVDGRRVPGAIEGADWRLVPGRHTVELRATTPEGQRLRSRPSTVTVRGTPLATR